MSNKHGGNEPLTNTEHEREPLTFDNVNNAELVRQWKRDQVALIVANPALADSYRSAGFGGLTNMAIEQLKTDVEWADAHLLALREQMHEAGLKCETVADGVAFLLKLFEAQGKPDGWQASRFAGDAGAN